MTRSPMRPTDDARQPRPIGAGMPLSLRLLAAGCLVCVGSVSWGSALYQTDEILELTDSHDLYIQDHSLLETRSLHPHLYLTARRVLGRNDRLAFARSVLEYPVGRQTRRAARLDVRELGAYFSLDVHLYETAKSLLADGDIWRFAIVALHGSSDPHVQDAALDELGNLSVNQTEALAFAESAVETFQLRVEPQSDVCRKAVLVQARLLLFLGEREEAVSLFETAINREWPDATEYYIRSIRDVVGITPAYMVELYLQAFEDPGEDLYWFFRNMVFPYDRPFKTPAMEDVQPFCIRHSSFPEYEELARAACLAVDERYGEAGVVLDALAESQLSDGEYRNIPIYRIIVLAKQGEAADLLPPLVEDYMRRNSDRLMDVRERLIAITYCLESAHPRSAGTCIAAISASLIDKGLATDETQRELLQFGKTTWKNHLYDMKMVGLFRSGRRTEAREVCEFLTAEANLDDLAANNAEYTLVPFQRKE